MSEPIKQVTEEMTRREREAKGIEATLDDLAGKLFRLERLASESRTTAAYRMDIVTGLRAVQTSLALYRDHLTEDLDRLGVKA